MAALYSALNPAVTPGLTPLLPVQVPRTAADLGPRTGTAPVQDRALTMTDLPLISVSICEGHGEPAAGSRAPEARMVNYPV